ncbi:MAG: gamma-glutamyltransferase family protein [Hyphomonadaceae bacterium]
MQSRSLWAKFTAAALVLMLSACGGEPPVAASRGVVTSASPEATAAGVEILRQGGNAVDAAVAVQFALGVTEPAMSGLGGQTQVMIRVPGKEPVMINGTSYAPSGIPAGKLPDGALKTGWTAMTVPSTVRVMDFAQRTFGSGKVSWAKALQPAINDAEDGFKVGRFRALVYARHEEDLRQSATAAPIFLPGGVLPKEGDVVRQPVLATTLKRLAEAGADDFYTGEIAQQIAADMKTYGGWITAEDLASTPQPEVVPALHTTYRGYDVYTLGPPAGGWVMLVALNLLEQVSPDKLNAEGVERAQALLEALDLAHRSRDENSAVSAEAFAADLAARIKKGAPPPSTPAPHYGGETTHFSIVDANGMAVSVTTSIDSYFGSRAVSPTLGFLYNNYMQSLDEEPGHPFSVRPRAAPYSSMSATIVMKEGEPVLVLGSPGSARIISAVTQVTSHWVDVGAGVQAAVAAPRVHVVPDDDGRDNAYVEVMPEGLDVEAMGFDLVEPKGDLKIDGLNAYFGGVHAIGLDHGVWVGAADPRRDGAVGYVDPPTEEH